MRSGRPEDSDDPDRAYAQARIDELDPDEPEMSRAGFWLLRRGPVIALVVVGIFLFIVTAYASGGDGNTTTRAGSSSPSKVGPDMACVNYVDDQNAVRTDCNQENDGRVVREVTNVVDCPAGTKYASLSGRFVCVKPPPKDAPS